MEIEIRSHDLSEEQRDEFRRAAEEDGGEAVVEWEGAPHMVTSRRDRDGVELFVLEPIPRPFG